MRDFTLRKLIDKMDSIDVGKPRPVMDLEDQYDLETGLVMELVRPQTTEVTE